MPSHRPQCSVYIATSLDGYIARTDGGLDWLESVHREGEDYGYKAFFDSVDALVIGRKTYDAVLGFGAWPYEGKLCIVWTHRAPEAAHGEVFHEGTIEALIARVQAAGARRVYVDGGVVIRQFLASGLVDDLTISVVPTLLGSGIPLFGGGTAEIPLTLVSVRSFASGLVQLQYRLCSEQEAE